MCSHDIKPKWDRKTNGNFESDPARIALDSLIDFAIECAMELHQPSGEKRKTSVKHELCCKV